MYIGDKKRKLNTPALEELEDYLAEPLEELKNRGSILQYWRKRESLYPTLAKMAKDVLACPALQVKDNSLCLGILRQRKGIGLVLKHWKQWCFSETGKRKNSLNKKKFK